MYICADEGGRWQRLGRFAIHERKARQKRGGKIPLETCVFFFLGLESTTQQKRFAFWFGISFYFDKSEKKKEKKTLGIGEKSNEGEKKFEGTK